MLSLRLLLLVGIVELFTDKSIPTPDSVMPLVLSLHAIVFLEALLCDLVCCKTRLAQCLEPQHVRSLLKPFAEEWHLRNMSESDLKMTSIVPEEEVGSSLAKAKLFA